MFFLFLESIGTTEIVFIAIIALVVFGPRRLPELGRKFGRGMAEFRRASEDFKRTWEMEVETERFDKEVRQERALSALSEDDLTVESRPATLAPEVAATQRIAPVSSEFDDAETLIVARTKRPSNVSGGGDNGNLLPPEGAEVTERIVPTSAVSTPSAVRRDD